MKISFVTPSFNQVVFLENCIKSVLSQKGLILDYAVIDGGSTDGSDEVIQKYASSLSVFRIEPDQGQYHAIQKGFNLLHGSQADLMGWLNADDMLCPWAFEVIYEIFSRYPQVEWISSSAPLIWHPNGSPSAVTSLEKFSKEGFWSGQNLKTAHLQQESTFWRRSLWERSGGRFDLSLSLAADFELWSRFFRHAHCYAVPIPLGGFRVHPNQKTATLMKKYVEECVDTLKKAPPIKVTRLWQYKLMNWIAHSLGQTQRFTQIGLLPPRTFFRHDSLDGWVMDGPLL